MLFRSVNMVTFILFKLDLIYIFTSHYTVKTLYPLIVSHYWCTFTTTMYIQCRMTIIFLYMGESGGGGGGVGGVGWHFDSILLMYIYNI